MNLNEVFGIIFPLSQVHIDRFLGEMRKTVFVKFFGNEDIPNRIRPGSKLYFYQSGGKKEVVGEAEIVYIDSGNLSEVWKKYSDAIFLGRNELESYVGKRVLRRMLVLVLLRSKRYSSPLRLKRSVTMAGQYMTKKLYNELKTGM